MSLYDDHLIPVLTLGLFPAAKTWHKGRGPLAGPVVAAANIHIATCSPNFLILESIGTFEGSYMACLKSTIEWQDGYVIPPSAPGLGVELNDELIAANPYTDKELHLKLETEPVTP